MKQLNLIHPEIKKDFKRTESNVRAMKQCFRDAYNMGMVWESTMRKVEGSDYADRKHN